MYFIPENVFHPEIVFLSEKCVMCFALFFTKRNVFLLKSILFRKLCFRLKYSSALQFVKRQNDVEGKTSSLRKWLGELVKRKWQKNGGKAGQLSEHEKLTKLVGKRGMRQENGSRLSPILST
jgi:hypothetical protein